MAQIPLRVQKGLAMTPGSLGRQPECEVTKVRRPSSSSGAGRAWSEEEEMYLLQTRMQKVPYKHIAAHLHKTELACRLHYHQLTHGNSRRKRHSSRASSSSNVRLPSPPSSLIMAASLQDFNSATAGSSCHSSISVSPTGRSTVSNSSSLSSTVSSAASSSSFLFPSSSSTGTSPAACSPHPSMSHPLPLAPLGTHTGVSHAAMYHHPQHAHSASFNNVSSHGMPAMFHKSRYPTGPMHSHHLSAPTSAAAAAAAAYSTSLITSPGGLDALGLLYSTQPAHHYAHHYRQPQYPLPPISHQQHHSNHQHFHLSSLPDPSTSSIVATTTASSPPTPPLILDFKQESRVQQQHQLGNIDIDSSNLIQSQQHEPHAEANVDFARLRDAYSSHRGAFWEVIAADYGDNASPWELEAMWQRSSISSSSNNDGNNTTAAADAATMVTMMGTTGPLNMSMGMGMGVDGISLGMLPMTPVATPNGCSRDIGDVNGGDSQVKAVTAR